MGMMMRAALIAIGLALALGGVAFSQTAAPGPMMQHYRAYVSAFESGDLEIAETEAVLALGAAEAARSSRIGVLAFNLAALRALHMHKFAEARASAERAMVAGGDGVSPARAAILMSLSRLPERSTRSEDLNRSIAEASDDVRFQYDAALAWGFWELSQQQEETAVTAYTQAVRAAEAMGDGGTLELTIALTGLGSAELLSDRFDESAAALRRAIITSAPLAPESEGVAAPYAEVVHLTAVAWFTTLQSKLTSDRKRPPESPEAVRRQRANAPPLCRFTLDRAREVEYPARAQAKYSVGTIVLRFSANEAGDMTNLLVVTGAPATDFAPAVMEAVRRWRVRWDDSDTDCRRQSNDMTQLFRFVLTEPAIEQNSINRARRK